MKDLLKAQIHDQIDIYANEYGDQEVIGLMESWLTRKMGQGYKIVNTDHWVLENTEGGHGISTRQI